MALKLDKIKSLFVVSNENENTDIKKEDTIQQEQKIENNSEKKESGSKINFKISTGISVNNNQTEITNENSGGAFNEKIFNSLTQAIANANLPGEDYLEFIDALNAMKNIPLDEIVKIQTVFATLSTKGLTKQTVISSADHYLNILENERNNFNNALKAQLSGTVGKKDIDIKKLEESNQTKAEQIATLTEEINQNKQLIIKLKNEMQEAETKIRKTENDFIFTLEMLIRQINSNIEKVKTI